ncbi:MAG TPA: patatin-like phospholipase family protein [Anaerolineae bacterium]
MKIGLTLSGGGFRATVFHLGVLARLAEENRLEDVTLLSTVSGGSLCGALVYAGNQFTWPTSRQFIEQVLPKARTLLTTEDLQLGFIWRALRSPITLFEPRANLLSALLKERWGVTASLSSLPGSPRWLINATCYETGKNWRFESFRMGDYVFGYSNDTDIPLSDAVAASSGFPGLIGPLVLDTRRAHWFKYRDTSSEDSPTSVPDTAPQKKTIPVDPAFSTVHLWDGGVYDNFGMEGVFDIDEGWRKDVDFLIVSDAAGVPHPEAYQWGIKGIYRMITGILMDQIRSLRTRAVLGQMIKDPDSGVLLRTGATSQAVLLSSAHKEEITTLGAQCLDEKQATLCADYATTLRRMPVEDFDLLFRHGFEVADYTLYAYSTSSKFIGYAASHFGQAGSPVLVPSPATA